MVLFNQYNGTPQSVLASEAKQPRAVPYQMAAGGFHRTFSTLGTALDRVAPLAMTGFLDAPLLFLLL
jgi:hypothetical protein